MTNVKIRAMTPRIALIFCALRGHRIYRVKERLVQTADLIEWQNSAGLVLASVTGPALSYCRCLRCGLYERMIADKGGKLT